MKPFRFVFVCIVGLFCTNNLLAQSVLSSSSSVKSYVYDKQHTSYHRPIPLPYVREADVMWSRTVIRKIQLTEKINQHLYFPTRPMDDRISLIDLIMYGIEQEGLVAYNPDNPSEEFSTPMSWSDILSKFDANDRRVWVPDVTSDSIIERVIAGEIKSWEVTEYLIKEQWFFDRNRSMMDVRIIGICPIREYYSDTDVDRVEPRYKKVCWIYFDQFRPLLANHEVFNMGGNDAARLSFDDVFIKRVFNGYIVQENNMYDNRPINEYAQGFDALIEADKIKQGIMNFELDMWEY